MSHGGGEVTRRGEVQSVGRVLILLVLPSHPRALGALDAPRLLKAPKRTANCTGAKDHATRTRDGRHKVV